MLNDRVVAHHEAGHALAAHALGRPINSVALTSSGGEFREYEVAAWEPTTREGKQQFRDAVLASLGPEHLGEMMSVMIGLSSGLAAQHRIIGHEHDDYGNADMEQCRAIAAAVAPEAQDVLLSFTRAEADRLVAQHWPEIEALASRLLARRRLDGDEIRAILIRPQPGRELFYERRAGVTRPTATPDPLRRTSVTMRRTDGFIRG
jgi:hypothetical protein